MFKVSCLLEGQYSANKNLRRKNLMLKLDLWYYSDAYIVVKGTIDVLAAAKWR